MRKFTVHVQIEETTRDEPKKTCRCMGTPGSCGHALTSSSDKKTTTILNITLQALSLEDAIDKATKHLEAEHPQMSGVTSRGTQIHG